MGHLSLQINNLSLQIDDLSLQIDDLSLQIDDLSRDLAFQIQDLTLPNPVNTFSYTFSAINWTLPHTTGGTKIALTEPDRVEMSSVVE